MAAPTVRLLLPAAAAAAALLRTSRSAVVSASRRTPRSTPFTRFHTASLTAATTKCGWQGGTGTAPGIPRLFFSSEAGVGGGTGDGNENGAAATAPATEAAAGVIGSTLRFKSIVDGRLMVPEEFVGKAVLVVNTASLCG